MTPEQKAAMELLRTNYNRFDKEVTFRQRRDLERAGLAGYDPRKKRYVTKKGGQ